MFGEHGKHEMGLKRLLFTQLEAERISRKDGFLTRLRLRRRNGAAVFFSTDSLDRKVRHIYPRGQACERMMDITQFDTI